jgi:hypothetical protein
LGATLILVSRTEPLLLRVEIDRDVSPISGRVVSDLGPERPFAGWTELFAALDTSVTTDGEVENPGGNGK